MMNPRAAGAALAFTLTLAYFSIIWLSEVGCGLCSSAALLSLAIFAIRRPGSAHFLLYEPLVREGGVRLRLGWWAVLGGLVGVLAAWLISEVASRFAEGVELPVRPLDVGLLILFLLLSFIPQPRLGEAERVACEALCDAVADLRSVPPKGVVDSWLLVAGGSGARLAKEIARLERRLKKLRDQAEIFKARLYLHETRGVPLEDWIPVKAKEVEAEIREVESRLERARSELEERFRRALSAAS